MTDCRIIRADIVFTVRKHVCTDEEAVGLATALRDARSSARMTVRDVAEMCGVPVTEAEHWFRTDTYSAVPSETAWRKLRTVFGLERFDGIVEKEETLGRYDMACRAYSVEGLSPTVTNMGGGGSQGVKVAVPR